MIQMHPVPSSNVLAAHLDGEAVLLDLSSKRYFRLNATGAAIWQGLEAGHGPEQIVDTLISQFEVEREVAVEAVEDLISDLTERGLLTTDAPDDRG